jgi:hypothetical protein
MVRNYLRKKRHLRYVNKYLNDIRWDIINTTIASSATGFNEGTTQHLNALGVLIRKYERRRRLLKF